MRLSRFFFILIVLSLAFFLFCAAGRKNPNVVDGKPVVFMTTEITPESLVEVYKALGVKPQGKVAVKISTGEPGGHNFLQPALIKDFVQEKTQEILRGAELWIS